MALNYLPRGYFANLRRPSRSSAKPTLEAQQSQQNEMPGAGMANSRMRRALKKGAVTDHNNGNLYERILNSRLPVSSRGDRFERTAEQLAGGRRTGTGIAGDSIGRLTTHAGQQIPVSQRRVLEPALGHSLDDVRVHKTHESEQAAALLGAEAFTHGRDIYLSDRAQLGNSGLLAHEAAHAIQNQDAIQRREATWLERRAWLGFFDHYLPRKFLNNYMDDTGNSITLTKQEMEDCNAVGVNIRRSVGFQNTLARLKAAGGGVEPISCTSLAGALTNGTLGNFTVRYEGLVSLNAETGDWVFVGTITFIDYWDFNTGGANRPIAAEVKVRVANALLPGSPFSIDSEAVAAYQTQTDSEIQWNAAAPAHVPDNLVRGGADMGVGGDVGAGADISTGGDAGAGLDVGAEAGAQTNADF